MQNVFSEVGKNDEVEVSQKNVLIIKHPSGLAFQEWIEPYTRNTLSYNEKELLAFFTISSPIASPAVAAGLGAFNTWISRSVVSK